MINFIKTRKSNQAMKYIIPFFALFFILAGLKAFCQQDGHDATYEKIIKEYTLNKDGSYDYREVKQLKLITHYSFNRLFGETFIIYHPGMQELKINESYTTMADGKKVVTPENAFNELLPRFASNAPAYNDLREMAITHTGLEVGATIYLDYTLETRPGFMPFFMGKEEIRQNVPVEEMEIVVRVPEDVSLKYRVLNIRTAPDIFQENGEMVYRWSFRGIRPNTGEKYVAHEKDPVLFFSIFDLQRAFFSFLNQDAFRHQLPTEVEKKAIELSKDKGDEISTILSARDWLLERMSSKEIPLKYTGYKVRPSAEVWESTYSSSLELAIILSDMLLKAGINAYPVAGIPASWFGRQIGNLEMFEGFLVQVNPKKHGRIYLNPGTKDDQNQLYSAAGKTYIQLDGAIESVRTFEEKDYTSELIMEASITIPDTANLVGDVLLEAKNAWNPYFMLYKDPESAGRPLNVKADADKITIEKLTEAEAKAFIPFEDPSTVRRVEDFLLVRLPGFNGGIDTYELGSLPAERTETLTLPEMLSENYTYEISVSPEWQVVGEPVTVVKEKDFGRASLYIKAENNALEIIRHIHLDKKTFSPAEYTELMELIEVWDMKRGRELILKRTTASD